MNRQGLEQLIAFGIHLSLRNNAGWIRSHPGEELVGDLVAARDALELSRIARRLHYLDERYAFTLSDQRIDRMLSRAHELLRPYGYHPYPFHEGAKGLALRLATAPFEYNNSDWAVPY